MGLTLLSHEREPTTPSPSRERAGVRGELGKPGGLMKYESLCGKVDFALTLSLSPRRGDICA